MLKRCYNQKALERNPGYVGCSVVSDWLLFSTFKEWMKGKSWKGMVLDKDLKVPGNKVYGPDACLFIPSSINTLLNTQPSQRGLLPLGVVAHGSKFKVSFKKNKKTCHFGVFDSIEEASECFRREKALWVEECASALICLETKAALYLAASAIRKGS